MAAGFLPLLDIRMAWGAGLRAGVREFCCQKPSGFQISCPAKDPASAK